MPCIYSIKNIINNKEYIGQTVKPLEERWKIHKQTVNKFSHRPLYKAILEYGIENFAINKIIDCTEEDLDNLEIHYINLFDTRINGYNATLGGQSRKCFSDSYILQIFNEINSVKETAEYLEICKETVQRALKRLNIPNLSKKKIYLVTYKKEFNSISDAAKWLIENKYTTGSHKSVQTGISKVLMGVRKTYLKSFIEEL